MRGTAVCRIVIGIAMATSVVLVGPSANAITGTAARASGTSPQVPGRHVVTLITGDRVAVLERADGRREVTIVRGPGREHIPFLQQGGRDAAGQPRLEVVPLDAVSLVKAGQLDRRLFDVTGLIKAGYDDKSRSEVPLIVSFAPGVSAQRAAITAATVQRALPSINGAAVRSPKSDVAKFWASVTGSAGAAAPRAAGVPQTLGSSIAKIWLDGRKKLLDDESNAQIGVPTAWAAGFTGKGVTVAVLDGGYDPTHPDLKAVAEAKDFTGGEDPTDFFGHGTHVAGIVAGSGAAAGGRHKGVAPDATLLVGKVCSDFGCDDSAILAGMEWAATEKHAKIISMSLGTADGTDGTDPIAQAVNNLTASAGSLFVIAAGNSGAPGTVGSPGSADAALTVASVGRTDVLSDFSSHGPRVGDFVVKPDIAAPGEDIIAARAAGTELGPVVDEFYVAISGTSMATPHVSGAAAILAQQHPDWTAARLKAALMSTAKPIDATVYGQGAGRVDVARVVTQQVRAETGSVSYGLLRWPFAAGAPVTRTVTYRNDGDAAVTLTLAVSATGPTGAPAAAGAFTTTASTVTVPAHGIADVGLTVHPDQLGTTDIGSFSGRLVATGPGSVVVQTAIGVTTEPESFDVNFKVIDRNGKPAGDAFPAIAGLILLDQRGGFSGAPSAEVSGGTARIRVRKGVYGSIGLIASENPAVPGSLVDADLTTAAVPKVTVDRPGIVLTYDARRGRAVGAIVPGPQPTAISHDAKVQFSVQTDFGLVPITASLLSGPGNHLFAVPVRGDPKVFAFGFETTAVGTGTGGAPDRSYFLAIPVLGQIPANPTFRLSERDLHLTVARYHTQGVPAAIGDRVEFPFYLPNQTDSSTQLIKVPMPSTRLEIFNAGSEFHGNILQQYLPGDFAFPFDGQIEAADTVYRGGTVSVQDWGLAAANADLSNGLANSVVRVGNKVNALLSPQSPGEAGHGGNGIADFFAVSGSFVLSRDGVELGRGFFPTLLSADVAADTGRYTLTQDTTRSKPWATLSTHVVTKWEFTSGPPAGAREFLSLPTVKISGDLDGTNSTKGGALFTLRLATTTQLLATPSTVTSASLEFSADDGTTWQTVQVRADRGGVFTARLTNPASGFVSLRVKLTNAAGNTLEQTIIRAYALSA